MSGGVKRDEVYTKLGDTLQKISLDLSTRTKWEELNKTLSHSHKSWVQLSSILSLSPELQQFSDIAKNAMKRHAELLEIMQMNYSLFSVEIPALASSVIQDLDDLQIEPKKNQMQLLGNIKMLFEAITSQTIYIDSTTDEDTETIESSEEVELDSEKDNTSKKITLATRKSVDTGKLSEIQNRDSNTIEKTLERKRSRSAGLQATMDIPKKNEMQVRTPSAEVRPLKKSRKKLLPNFIRSEKKSSSTKNQASQSNSFSIDDSSTRILPMLKLLEENDEICFDYDPINPSMPVVRYGTLPKIIERLSLPAFSPDSELTEIIFITYPVFCTSKQLLETFEQRIIQSQKVNNVEDHQRVVLRIISMIKVWKEKNNAEFEPDTPFRILMDKFIDEVLTKVNSGAAAFLKKHLPSKEPEIIRRPRNIQANFPSIAVIDHSVFSPDRICFEELNSLEVARQLTLEASSIFEKLQAAEFSNKNWCSKDKEKLSPNIIKLTKQFNKQSQWTVTEVLKQFKLNERVNILKKLIELARYFKEFNNFHGLVAVLSGLQSSSVKRLSLTWAKISEDDKNFIEQMGELMSFRESYKNYRAALAAVPAQTTVLPFIGVFLTDLVYIEDGNPSIVHGDKINIHKFTMIGKIMKQIIDNNHEYRFFQVPAILQWFSDFKVIDEEEAYLLSTKIEPRDTNEAFETLLLSEQKLRKELEDAKVQNDSLKVRERNNIELIRTLSSQLLEQRKALTFANSEDETFFKRYSSSPLAKQSILPKTKSTQSILNMKIDL